MEELNIRIKFKRPEFSCCQQPANFYLIQVFKCYLFLRVHITKLSFQTRLAYIFILKKTSFSQVSFFYQCFITAHFRYFTTYCTAPSSSSVLSSISCLMQTDFPRAEWTGVECVLLTFTRGQEPQPPGRETGETDRKRER